MNLQNIRMLICDVDGVLSNGMIYLGNNNNEFKSFNAKDGYGLKALMQANVNIAIITGRNSDIVTNRMQSLGISEVYQGINDKLKVYQELKTKFNLKDNQIAYIGDDIPDLIVMQKCFGIAVADAHPKVKEVSDYITKLKGGYGAVREVCDIILQSQEIDFNIASQ